MYIWMYIWVMPKRFSIADARANLPALVDEVEAGKQVELTRRGKPVAVVISPRQYARLASARPSFSQAYRAFLARYAREDFAVGDDFFIALRDRTSGRKVNL
jgi:prevent-host-death family protein